MTNRNIVSLAILPLAWDNYGQWSYFLNWSIWSLTGNLTYQVLGPWRYQKSPRDLQCLRMESWSSFVSEWRNLGRCLYPPKEIRMSFDGMGSNFPFLEKQPSWPLAVRQRRSQDRMDHMNDKAGGRYFRDLIEKDEASLAGISKYLVKDKGGVWRQKQLQMVAKRVKLQRLPDETKSS